MVCVGIGEKSKERRKGMPPVASATDDMQSFIGRRTKDGGMWFGPGYSSIFTPLYYYSQPPIGREKPRPARPILWTQYP